MAIKPEIEDRQLPQFGLRDSQIALSGINHRSAQLSLRECFASSQERSGSAVTKVLRIDAGRFDGPDECVLISTCNRVELVSSWTESVKMEPSGCGGQQKSAVSDTTWKNVAEQVFAEISGLEPQDFRSTLYHYRGREAVGHLFGVAAGLDSMVLGEPQILGQVKRAYFEALTQGTAKSSLNQLFQSAFAAAKRVRCETELGRHSLSVCYAASLLAEQIFGDLSQARVMVVGAGDTAELAIKNFKSRGVKHLFVLNRSEDRALEVGRRYQATSLGLEGLETHLAEVDIVVGAVTLSATQKPIVSFDHAARAQHLRRNRPQFFVDLSVPRSMDENIDSLTDVYLYNVDHLKDIVERNKLIRQVEAQRAKILLEEEVDKYLRVARERSFDPLVKTLQSRLRLHVVQESQKVMKRLKRSGLGIDEQEIVGQALNQVAEAVLAKALHAPLKALKEQAPYDPGLLSAFCDLFELKSDDKFDQ